MRILVLHIDRMLELAYHAMSFKFGVIEAFRDANIFEWRHENKMTIISLKIASPD